MAKNIIMRVPNGSGWEDVYPVTKATNVTVDGGAGNLQNELNTKVSDTRQIIAGTGLTGGGDLKDDRTISASIASQAQAEAGTANGVLMTPERTAQAINAKKGEIRTDVSNPIGMEVVSSFPSNPFDGQVIYHTGDKKYYGYANGKWV